MSLRMQILSYLRFFCETIQLNDVAQLLYDQTVCKIITSYWINTDNPKRYGAQ